VPQVLEDGPGLFPGVTRGVVIAGGVMRVAEAGERHRLLVKVPDRAEKTEGLAVALDGLPVVAEVVVGVAEAVQRFRLPGLVAEVALSNISARSCTLDGFPAVTALSAKGAKLGDAAAGAGKKQLITLQHGQTAHFILDVTDVTIFPASSCGPVSAAALRVAAPGAKGIRLDLTIKACGKATAVPYLDVIAVENGAGVPDLDS